MKFANKEIPKSPFEVMVEGAAGDASKVTAAGPGLERSGVQVKKKTYFEVFTKGECLHFQFLRNMKGFIFLPLKLYSI